jgi:hypothetical protein
MDTKRSVTQVGFWLKSSGKVVGKRTGELAALTSGSGWGADPGPTVGKVCSYPRCIRDPWDTR